MRVTMRNTGISGASFHPLAAVGACAVSLAIVVPCISQVWFTGPIAKRSGDLGFETGLVASVVLYVPLRCVEKRVFGR